MPVSGILGQKLGHRLRFVVVAGSLSVGISFVILLFFDRDSSYVDFLPAFLFRGLGIGLVMSATSLAVVSAMPVAKSGLASGTLTMSRQIGTSLGVALFGAVFLYHVDATLPDRLAAVPPAQSAAAVAAADHFVPVGEGSVRVETEEVIVEGFVRIATVGVAVCALATLAAFMIRHRAQSHAPAPAPVAAVPPGVRPEQDSA